MTSSSSGSHVATARGQAMDVELPQALTEMLLLLSEARCRVEGEVALITAVNRDLRTVLRWLRNVQHIQQLPSSAQQVLATQQRLHQLPAVHQVSQQGPANVSTVEAAVSNAGLFDSRSAKTAQRRTPTTTATAVGRCAANSAVGPTLAAARSRAQATPQPVASRSSSGSSRGKTSASSATRAAPALARSHAASNSSVMQAAAAATAAAAVAHAPLLPVPAVLQLEQQQDDSAPAPTELPSSFVRLLQQYSSLQQQVKELAPPHQQQQGGITNSAAAGFMASLQKAYGPSAAQPLQPQQQQSRNLSIVKQLSLFDFSQQAEYVGLVSAALWAVQALTKTNSAFCSSDHLQPTITGMMQQCQDWLDQHAARQQHQQQLLGSTAKAWQQVPSRQQNPVEPQIADVVRWRNRCLRSILSTAQSIEASQLAATGAENASAASPAGQPPVQAGMWLPTACWQPLTRATAATKYSTSSTGPGARGQAMQQMLTPSWQAQQQPQHGSAVCGQVTHAAGPGQLPVLYYADIQELVQHSRHLQKLQQLLLHRHIEAQLAPRLIHCLVDGCQQLSQQVSRTDSHHHQQQEGWTVERCLALYRLLYALTAAPAKRRGLGGACHAVEHEAVDDIAMLQWVGM